MKKTNKLAKKLSTVSAETIKIIILIIPLSILIVRKILNHQVSFEDYFDTDIIVSFVFIFICENIAMLLSSFWGKKIEDENKLTVDYKKLVKKYQRANLLTCDDVKLPVEVIYNEPGTKIEFDDSNYLKKYELPSQIKGNSLKLMSAHKYSNVYNNMTVRIDSIKYDEQKKTATIIYSKTTYYDHLITNRAMDYRCLGNKSIREIYEPGPFVSSLEESKLANQLGFNGFVEFADNRIVLVKRNSNLSVAKNLWSPSVSASYKVMYGIDDNQKMTLERMSYAIQKEIEDELKISFEKDDKEISNSIIGFYRDFVEGGKPHFVFDYKFNNLDSNSFLKQFEEKYSHMSSQQKKKGVVIDGKQFEFFTRDELKMSKIEIDGIIINNKKYYMNPSLVGAVIMAFK